MCPSPYLLLLHAKQRFLDQNYKSLRVPALICGFCIQNSTFRTTITSLSGSQTTPMVFCIQNSDFSIRITSLYGSQTSPVILCMQNSAISTRITSLHGSQTSPVVLCVQNNVISIRITSLYWSKPSFVAFTCKPATFGSELQVSMGPSPRLWYLHVKQQL